MDKQLTGVLCYEYLKIINPKIIILLIVHLPSAQAGQLEVLNGASTIGNDGLRVTAGKTCVNDDLVIPVGPIIIDQIACDSITTTGSSAVTSPVLFVTNGSITLNPGFSVTQGTTFNAKIDPFVNIPYAFVENRSPNSETSYKARFDLNTDGINLSIGEDIEHFTARSSDNTVQFQLLLRLIGIQKHLILVARDGGVLVENGTTISLPAGFNSIFAKWKSRNGNGEFQVILNNNAPIGTTNLTNNTGRIDSVRWGLIDGPVAPSTTGFIDQDDFFSFR